MIAPLEEELYEPEVYVSEVCLNEKRVSEDLGPNGVIAATMSRYEDRGSQRDMAALIARLYNTGGVGLIEAGTGVGKSLGYLLPALRWAAANNERTVVSTNTINLQEQLVGKDLPFLERALSDEQPVKFALLKGWRNYLCKLRLAQATTFGPELVEDEYARSMAYIAQWAESTTEGSLTSLDIQPSADVWDEVSAEPDLCTRTKCAHYQDCFLFKARREALQAQVIVVNHHLLMSDVAVRRAQGNWDDNAVIPAYSRLIIDEGHHLEDAASAHLGSATSRRAIQRLFGRLERRGRGLLATLTDLLSAREDLISAASLDIVKQNIVPSLKAARERTDLLFNLLYTVLKESDQPVLRLADNFTQHQVWSAGLTITLADLLREIQNLGASLTRIRERLEGAEKRDEKVSAIINELRGVVRRLEAAGDAIRYGLRPPVDAEQSVRWIEVRGKDSNVAISSVPIDLAPILRDDLFEQIKTTVVTSATLAAEGRFDFLKKRLGLDDSTHKTMAAEFPSPFNYPEQAVLAIPTNVPAPNEAPEVHANAVQQMVIDVVNAAGGGVFALFTSHRDVRAAAQRLREAGLDKKYNLLVHGEQSRESMIAAFMASRNSVLLGTASYWEGVDVPGEALRALVIARIPFRVPSEPVTAAQCEMIEARGGNSFSEYMLPHASLRLKQGFGRLIRGASDRGVVVIADPRIKTKRYGEMLLRGLPPARQLSGNWSEILPQIRAFYSGSGE